MKDSRGFTLVELLIVIIVIAILAAITIVAYNGVQESARASSLQQELSQAVKKLEIDKFNDVSERYPSNQAAANLSSSNGIVFTYYYGSSDNSYCLNGTLGDTTYSATSSQKTVKEGSCAHDGLSGQWLLNGNSNDSISSQNLTTYGAILTTGQNGQPNSAYSFNGTTAYIQGALLSAPITNVTISAWGLVQAGTKGTLVHVGLGDGYSIGLGSGFNSTNARVTALFPGRRWIDTSTSATTGWHHFALTLSSTSVPSIYYDGTFLGSPTGNNPWPAYAQLSIGRNTGDEGASQAERSFNSSIDDVRMYNHMLSDAEIKAIFSEGAK